MGIPERAISIIFNNNYINNRSATVFEIVPPLNVDGTYSISEVEPYGPAEPVWLHTEISILQCGGAFRLPNGNTLITDCDDATIFEVTYDNQLVWSHQESGARHS